ncbi:inhibitor of nuclear factor kappa-B kinase subunit epsilon isoform X1 [Chelonia mydas]|uniref:inhibitor of nuclear factor kappa-B kinase subunit epsilon isoform X1 n=1 Tax=Chelonia mydas TaxID=8469 RepID=UPI0018A23D2E|nr:inhibitor of nuclear factor kappa-B kinase subunit epsilon isoform X1 [Chelonia mydas]XP_037740958.1 inhibitor of nuclear factor kappa-B kinase subunit epsilon isoform X1 [Chelonia mydas]XP_043389636.1 inhibitor of nuclear factor kappa-B kinase subunit epsilon isoform X1 [Chelonia mydas]XP_043389637.1 inhibitor of nuclear factor kappa-B kinase subunit epsilon isoform X1 [Chelonia mydas]
MLKMQSTPNYLWNTDDVLGQGATASVYKARSKRSGELVAVKVFNNASYLRPQEVQMREFEVLRKLNHKNIVKLFAVEETTQGNSKQKVLVMEYCSCGSLLSVLEDPENSFGLSESEFLIVLHCVVAGMNHLRENSIVHRDIKPGNIMRLVGEDGQSIYKLTDFGAARELDDDEKFVSVYGTEEYLHPDMYERAVLRKPQQKAYGVTVDLWSIGVTFYHAATGSLPFIPFGGPRRNKEIMYKITTEKPAGAIAGVQRQENGPIEWSYELPITCQLSVGLKSQLIPILANILEVDQEKCWGFDQFFAETSDILHRIVVHVFSLQQATMHRVYIHAYNTTTIFLEAVFTQTNIAPPHQEYFFEGHLYQLEPTLQAHNFSRTTENSPLTLLSSEPEEPVGVRFRDPSLEFPKFVPKVDVLADCSMAKGVLSAVHQTLKISRSLLKCQEFILRGLHWVIESLKAKCSRVLERREAAVSMLSCLQHTELKAFALYDSVSGGNSSPEAKDLAEVKTRLQTVTEDLTRCSLSISEHKGTLDSLLSEVVKHRKQTHEDSIRQMECCLERMQLIYKQFKKTRMTPRLAYNEEQIHKLDKLNLGHLAKKVLSVFQEDCVQKYQVVLATHGSITRKIWEMREHLKKVSNSIAACSVEMMGCQECLHNALDKLPQKILREKPNLAQVSSAPSPMYMNLAHQEMVLRMKELREQMKLVADDLQSNNIIIERLSGVASAPDV